MKRLKWQAKPRSARLGKDGAALLANDSDVETGLEAIRATLQSREAVLLDGTP
jgi:hypothetical protein